MTTVKSYGFTMSLSETPSEVQRVDSYLAMKIPNVSRSKIQSAILSGAVLVNDRRISPSYRLKPGDKITASFEDPVQRPLVRDHANDLEILHEDNDIIVINKPAGLVVHGGAGSHKTTLVEKLLAHTQHLSRMNQQQKGEGFRPGIVHRLDKDTSGALIIAKNDFAHDFIAKQFAQKSNLRQYIALLNGTLHHPELIVETRIVRDPKNRTRFVCLDSESSTHPESKGRKSKVSKSIFKTEAIFFNSFTLASVKLFTGRTHQIRVQAKHMGFPILGDPWYGRALQKQNLPEEIFLTLKGVKRQMLHAWILELVHPRSNTLMTFKAPLPMDFKEILDELIKFAKSSKFSTSSF